MLAGHYAIKDHGLRKLADMQMSVPTRRLLLMDVKPVTVSSGRCFLFVVLDMSVRGSMPCQTALVNSTAAGALSPKEKCAFQRCR